MISLHMDNIAESKATGEKPISKRREEIIKEAGRLEEGVQLSSKGHFSTAHSYKRLHYIFGIPMVALSVTVGTTALATLDSANLFSPHLTIILAVLASLMTFLNPNEKAGNHFTAGNSYSSLENQVRIFRTIECWDVENDQLLTDKLKYFSEQRDKLNHGSPQIPWIPYKMAQFGIWMGEARYNVDRKKGK
jgi:hypothetical protein